MQKIIMKVEQKKNNFKKIFQILVIKQQNNFKNKLKKKKI